MGSIRGIKWWKGIAKMGGWWYTEQVEERRGREVALLQERNASGQDAARQSIICHRALKCTLVRTQIQKGNALHHINVLTLANKEPHSCPGKGLHGQILSYEVRARERNKKVLPASDHRQRQSDLFQAMQQELAHTSRPGPESCQVLLWPPKFPWPWGSAG